MGHFECCLNQCFWRSKSFTSWTNWGEGGVGNLDKIQKNSSFLRETVPKTQSPLSFISTDEGAPRIPLAYDNHPIPSHPSIHTNM